MCFGGVHIANDFAINLGPGATLSLGDNFSSNYGLLISCGESISFGANCLLGWNCTFIDGDGHSIFDSEGNRMNPTRRIVIGNHVWISAKASCLKGTRIADNCVVGFNSMCSKEYEDSNCLLAGMPARVCKENINWKH